MEKKSMTKTEKQLRLENEELRSRLNEADGSLNAIRNGEVDAIIVNGPDGDKIFSLVSAETPYRIIVEEMNQGVVTLSADGIILYCNLRFAELVSIPLEQIMGSNFARFVAESEKPKYDLLIQNGLSGRSSGDIIYFINDSNPMHFNLSLSALPPEMFGDICIMIADVTELKQKEEDLRRSYDTLELQVIERTKTLTQTIEELADSRIAALNMMEDAIEAKNALENLNKELNSEILERKRAEETLRKNEELLHTVLDNAPITIYALDSQGVFTLSEGKKLELVGLKPGENVGVSAFGLFSTLPFVEHDGKVITGNDVISRVLDGESITAFSVLRGVHFDNHIVPFRNKDGNVAGIIGVATDITEQKQAEESLIKSEKKYREVVESANEIIYTTDIKGKFTYVNPSGLKLVGYTPKEFLLFNYLELISHEHRSRVKRFYYKQFINKIPNSYIEFPYLTKAGETKWFGQNATLMFEKNEPVGFQLIARDITERKQAEDALKTSEQRYRELTEQMPLPLFETDLNGKLTYANNAAFDAFGYTFEDFIKGVNLFQMISPEDLDKAKERISSIIMGGSTTPSEYYAQKKDGSIFPTIAYSNVIIKDNKPAGMRGFIFDITDRKKAEEELLKLRKAVESSGEAIYMTDINGTFTLINPEFTKLFGWTDNEVIGKVTPRILKSEHTDPEMHKILWSTLLNKEVYKWEVINRTRDRRDIFIEGSANPILDETGNITGFLAIQKDITERKQNEIELIKAKEGAEEMNRLKSNFLANMSHELRTPMNGIIGFSQLLQFEDELDSIKEISELIYKSSKRLMSTLNSILDLSRIGAGEMKANYTLADVVELAHEAVNVFKAEAKQKHLSIKVESKKESILVTTDQKIVIEILINLISNALKFTHEGGVTVKISQVKSNKKDYIIYNVIDTGIGIDEKDYDTIFVEFRQVSEGLSRGFEGTGLGLTICKRYAELLGGTIEVKSKLGEGSIFIVKIPVTIESEGYDEEKEETKEETIKAVPQAGKKPLILYVEDDEVSVYYVGKLLKGAYDVEIAKNSAESVKMVKKKQYSLILMDINLGKGANGIDATRAIRKMKNYRDVPIIALTAYAMVGDREIFLAEGCSDYLSKPFEGKELLDILNKYL